MEVKQENDSLDLLTQQEREEYEKARRRGEQHSKVFQEMRQHGLRDRQACIVASNKHLFNCIVKENTDELAARLKKRINADPQSFLPKEDRGGLLSKFSFKPNKLDQPDQDFTNFWTDMAENLQELAREQLNQDNVSSSDGAISSLACDLINRINAQYGTDMKYATLCGDRRQDAQPIITVIEESKANSNPSE